MITTSPRGFCVIFNQHKRAADVYVVQNERHAFMMRAKKYSIFFFYFY